MEEINEQSKPSGQNRRKLKNIFLDPKNQLNSALPHFLLGFVILSGLFGMVIYGVNDTITSFAEFAPATEETQQVLDQTRLLLWGVYITLMLGFLFSSIFLGALITHRYLGPIVPIHRHVKKMLEGDFTGEIKLRKGDQFLELAGDLNKLAENLRNANQKNS